VSDLGVLSHHYKTSAHLARELNRAVVALKKQLYGMLSEQTIPAKQMASRRQLMVRVLDTLLAEFTPGTGSDSGPAQTGPTTQAAGQPRLPIPASIVERIRQAHRETMSSYIEDLMSTRSQLLQDGQSLNEKDVKLLDELAATAGLDTAEVFRRMWGK